MHHEKERNCDFCKQIYIRKNIGKRWCSERCRFLSKVQKMGKCWIWKGGIRKGYGCHSFDGVLLGAHRASWMIFRGQIKKNYQVCHPCDNPLCVNPAHLCIGTTQNNTEDRRRKGRSANRFGENHPLHKLTEEKVKEIKLLLGKIKQKEIARLYHVDPSAISAIKIGRNWTHI